MFYPSQLKTAPLRSILLGRKSSLINTHNSRSLSTLSQGKRLDFTANTHVNVERTNSDPLKLTNQHKSMILKILL